MKNNCSSLNNIEINKEKECIKNRKHKGSKNNVKTMLQKGNT